MHGLSWGPLCEPNFLCISVLRVASGPRVKLASCKSALNPRWFILLTVLRRGPGVSLTLWCFVVYSAMLYVLPCAVLFLCFSILLALRLPRLGKRELILVLFVRMFDRFVLVWICRFPLPLDGGLRFVIVALPGLFSYLFCRG